MHFSYFFLVDIANFYSLWLIYDCNEGCELRCFFSNSKIILLLFLHYVKILIITFVLLIAFNVLFLIRQLTTNEFHYVCMLLIKRIGYKDILISKNEKFCFCLSFHKGVAHYSYGNSVISCMYNECCRNIELQKLFQSLTTEFDGVSLGIL